MKLITKAIQNKLEKNRGVENARPALKLFTPWTNCTWLITEIEEDGDTMFGLCDLGMGQPELGYVSLSELQSVKGPFGLKIERDMYFEAEKPIMEYYEESSEVGRIAA
jgi:hypothetical protein